MNGGILNAHLAKVTDSVMRVEADKRLAPLMSMAEKHGMHSNIYERGVTAQLLQNFKEKVMDSYQATSLGEQRNVMSDFGPYIPHVLPVITAWYAEFPLKDLISVQAMEQPLTYLLFSKLVTGTNQSPTLAGMVVETPLGPRQIHGTYDRGVVIGEVIPSDQLMVDNGRLVGVSAYNALRTSDDYIKKFKLVIDNAGTETEYRAVAEVNGQILMGLSTAPGVPVEGAVWDKETGIFYIPTTASDPTGITVTENYVRDLDWAIEENIPKVKEQVERVQMEAQPSVLQMQWTIFAEALKKSQFGKDIRTENTTRVLDLLYQMQVRYILDDLYENAEGVAEENLHLQNAGLYDLNVVYNNVMRQLVSLATQIEMVSGVMMGNRLVVGRDFATWCWSLPDTMFKKAATPDGFSSPRFIGDLGMFKVYFDPRRKADEALMTWKGSEFYMAPYYMGIFLPIVPTDAVVLGVTARQSFARMDAFLYHRPNTVIKFKVDFGTEQ